MILYENILKIHDIFLHMKICEKTPLQVYDPVMRPTEEYRQYIMIGRGVVGLNAETVYCNTTKLSEWHLKIWRKRHKEVPHAAFILWIPEGEVYRIGFKY